jgi:WD40 repeat protein
MSATSEFFITGGTLPHDALSYVERRADSELWEALRGGDFCYVLTSRQMGKSSLMVRTAQRLREESIRVVVLDLTALGQNLTVAQWYRGILSLIGQQVDLEDEVSDHWTALNHLGPIQRLVRVLRDVVLPACPAALVIFLDEIDCVRSLPFSTDEFFAAIRECYNRRAEDPEFTRLAFCLLGVARPADLIADPRTTPFNIGRRIELDDFTDAEAGPLAIGLALGRAQDVGRSGEVARVLLHRVLYWTGGHPYLTQRLCHAVTLDPRAVRPEDVDRLCDDLFLSYGAPDRDDNLFFVRELLLRSNADRVRLLRLYERVLAAGRSRFFGGRVTNDPASPEAGLLRLSGVARVVRGQLRPRNRIYARVFNHRWIQENLPDAERRRERAARLRRLLLRTALAAAVAATVGGLGTALVQSRREAAARQRTVRLEQYVTNVLRAREAVTEGDFRAAHAVLERCRPGRGEEDFRGWEWHYLWRKSHPELTSFDGQSDQLLALQFAPNGREMWTLGDDAAIRRWQLPSGSALGAASLAQDREPRPSALAISPDGTLAAWASGRIGPPPSSRAEAWTVVVHDVMRNRPLHTWTGRGVTITSLAFSSDGRLLAIGTGDRNARTLAADIWLRSTESGAEVARLRGHRGPVLSLAFSSDGKVLASCGYDGTARTWSLDGKRMIASRALDLGALTSLALSDQGSHLIVGGVRRHPSLRSTVVVTDAWLRTELGRWSGAGVLRKLAVSPDGRSVAIGTDRRSAYIWQWSAPASTTELAGHYGGICALKFSPEGEMLAAASLGGTVRLWPANPPQDPLVLGTVATGSSRAVLSGDASRAALRVGDELRLWDNTHGSVLKRLPAPDAFDLSGDGRCLVLARGRWLEVHDLVTGHRRTAALPTPATTLAVSRDCRGLAAGTQRGVIWCDITNLTQTALPGPFWVTALAVSADNRSLAAAALGGTVRIWDLTRGREAARLEGQSADRLLFAPCGRRLVIADGGTVSVWDHLRGATTVYREVLPAGPALAVSPDGRTLAVTGDDERVRLYQLDSTRRVGWVGPSARARALTFTRDNGLAVATADGRLLLFKG